MAGTRLRRRARRHLRDAPDVDAFNRLNDPRSPHRVMLLVNKGTEGWNCPSLFACALVRRLKRSNNFVLQAATRCLRQVPGNTRPARIYLSQENFGVLDRQLRETYGEGLEELQRAGAEMRRERLVLRKRAVPPLVLRRDVTCVVRREEPAQVRLRRPQRGPSSPLRVSAYTIAGEESSARPLRQVGDVLELEQEPASIDLFGAAQWIAATYRLDPIALHAELQALYPDGELPEADLVGRGHATDQGLALDGGQRDDRSCL